MADKTSRKVGGNDLSSVLNRLDNMANMIANLAGESFESNIEEQVADGVTKGIANGAKKAKPVAQDISNKVEIDGSKIGEKVADVVGKEIQKGIENPKSKKNKIEISTQDIFHVDSFRKEVDKFRKVINDTVKKINEEDLDIKGPEVESFLNAYGALRKIGAKISEEAQAVRNNIAKYADLSDKDVGKFYERFVDQKGVERTGKFKRGEFEKAGAQQIEDLMESTRKSLEKQARAAQKAGQETAAAHKQAAKAAQEHLETEEKITNVQSKVSSASDKSSVFHKAIDLKDLKEQYQLLRRINQDIKEFENPDNWIPAGNGTKTFNGVLHGNNGLEELRQFKKEILELNPMLEAVGDSTERISRKDFVNMFGSEFGVDSSVVKKAKDVKDLIDQYDELINLNNRLDEIKPESSLAERARKERDEILRLNPLLEEYADHREIIATPKDLQTKWNDSSEIQETITNIDKLGEELQETGEQGKVANENFANSQNDIQSEISETIQLLEKEREEAEKLANILTGNVTFKGKREATDSLRHWNNVINDAENEDVRSSDKAILTYMNVRSTAEKLGVAQSSLDKYFNPIAIGRYDEALQNVNNTYRVQLQSIDLLEQKLSELQARQKNDNNLLSDKTPDLFEDSTGQLSFIQDLTQAEEKLGDAAEETFNKVRKTNDQIEGQMSFDDLAAQQEQTTVATDKLGNELQEMGREGRSAGESTASSINEIGNKAKETAENLHLITDKLGNIKTFYRGLRNSMGQGLVSDRFNGATFWTDNFDLAKEYAEWQKVEQAQISMIKPLEIEGNGANWNSIEYLGTSMDKASKKIIEAKKVLEKTIKQTNHDLRDLLSDKGFSNFKSEIESEISSVTENVSDKNFAEKAISELEELLNKTAAARQAYLEVSNDSSNVYGLHNTKEFVKLAQDSGQYDGVIFKNIIDSYSGAVRDLSNVIVQFDETKMNLLGTLSVSDNLNERDIEIITDRYSKLITKIEEYDQILEKVYQNYRKGLLSKGEIEKVEDEYNSLIKQKELYEKILPSLNKENSNVPEEISQQERVAAAYEEATEAIREQRVEKEKETDTGAAETAQKVEKEAESFAEAEAKAEKLAVAKKDVTNANQELAAAADKTASNVDKEKDAIESAGKAASKITHNGVKPFLDPEEDRAEWEWVTQQAESYIDELKEIATIKRSAVGENVSYDITGSNGNKITVAQNTEGQWVKTSQVIRDNTEELKKNAKAAREAAKAAEEDAQWEAERGDREAYIRGMNQVAEDAEREAEYQRLRNQYLAEGAAQAEEIRKEYAQIRAEEEAANKARIKNNQDVYKQYQSNQKQANTASEKELNNLLEQRADKYKEIWDINTKIAGLDENKNKGQISELEKQKEAAKELFNSIQKQLSASEEYYQIENRLTDLKKIQADAQDKIATNEAKERDKLTNELSGYEDTLKELSESGKYAGELGDKISEAANKAKELRNQLEDANIPIQELRNSMGSFAESFNDITVIQKQVDNLVKSIQSTINKKGAQGVDSDAIATLNDFITKLRQVGDQAGFDKLKSKYEAFIATVKTGGKELENSFNIDKTLKKLDKDFLGSSALKKFMPELVASAKELKEKLQSFKDSKIDFNTEEGRKKVEELKTALDELYDKKKLDQFKRATDTAWTNMGAKIESYMERNSAMGSQFKRQFEDLRQQWKSAESVEALKNVAVQFNNLEIQISKAGKTGKSFFDMIRDRATHSMASWFAMFFSFQDILRYARQIAQTVIEIDTATTELRKVSDASSARLSQNFQKSAETARELGSTIKDVINITADWARLGWLY